MNASEAACLFGADIHPYLSAYKLWAMRSGRIGDAGDSPAMKRGRLLEDDAIELAGEARPLWNIWRPHLYLRHPVWRIGCTPDAYFEHYGAEPISGVLQIKTVGRFAFNRDWKDADTGEIVPPLWVAVQASVEALLSGRLHCAVGAMVVSDGGLLDMHVLDIPLKPGIMTNLRRHVGEFWRRIKYDEPYPIDWGCDLETVLALNRYDDGSQIDLTEDLEVGKLLRSREVLKEIETNGAAAMKERRLIDAKLIERMGNARIASCGSMTIKAATVTKKGYEVKPTSFRQVSVKENAR